MHTRIVTTILGLAATLILSGCASTATEQQAQTAHPPMISASEFEAMINIEVTEVSPSPPGDTSVAAVN